LQELIQRLVELGKQAQPVLSEAEWIIVKPKEYQKAQLVDQVDIDGKNLLLPRGKLEDQAWGDPPSKKLEKEVSRGHST